MLFIDDDPAVIDATGMLLETEGVELYTAFDGDEALGHLARGVCPDVVVSDFRLPKYNGIEAVRRIRSETASDLPVVLMTGDTGSQAINEAGLRNCTVLHKPVDTSRLLELVLAWRG